MFYGKVDRLKKYLLIIKTDIVIQQVPEPEQPQLERETTGRTDTLEEAQLNAALHASAEEHLDDAPAEPPPTPKRRGRPPGSKNKPKIIEEILEEPYQTLVPIPTQVIEHPPRPEPTVLNEPPPKKPRKPRAPKAQPQAAPPTPHHRPTEAPVPQTPLQVAASMLEILRLEQAERQYRKGQLYKSWVK